MSFHCKLNILLLCICAKKQKIDVFCKQIMRIMWSKTNVRLAIDYANKSSLFYVWPLNEMRRRMKWIPNRKLTLKTRSTILNCSWIKRMRLESKINLFCNIQRPAKWPNNEISFVNWMTALLSNALHDIFIYYYFRR